MTIKSLVNIVNVADASAFAAPGSGTRRIQVAFEAFGAPDQFVYLGSYAATESFVLPAGLLGSVARCRLAGSSVTNLYVARNGPAIIQIQFLPGSLNGSLFLASDVSVAAGDNLTFFTNEIGPGFQDAGVSLLSSPVGQAGGPIAFESVDLQAIAPGRPAANGVRLFRGAMAGRQMPAFVGPVGVTSPLQAAFHGNSIFMVGPSSGSLAPTVFGGSVTSTGTISQTSFSPSGPWMTASKKRYLTAATAGSTAGSRSNLNQWHRGQGAQQGGFFFRAQFGHSINLSGAQQFVGLCALTTALAGDPSALVNMIGMGYDAGDPVAGTGV